MTVKKRYVANRAGLDAVGKQHRGSTLYPEQPSPEVAAALARVRETTLATHLAFQSMAEAIETARNELSPGHFEELESRASRAAWYRSLQNFMDTLR